MVNNVSNVNTDYRIRVTDVVEKENIQSSERENRPDNKGNEKNGLIFSEKGIIDVLKTNVLGRGIFVWGRNLFNNDVIDLYIKMIIRGIGIE